jgi:hypothetical protein
MGTYLPENTPRGAGGSQKAPLAVLAWILAIVFFVGLASVLSGGSPFAALTEGPMPLVWGVIVLVVALSLRAWRQRRLRWFNVVNGDGRRALAESDTGRALAIYEDLARRVRRPAHLGAIAAYNLAYTLERRGELAAALDRFAAVDAGLPRTAAGLRPALACHLALVNALYGDLVAAERWRRELDVRLSGVDASSLVGLVATVDAVVALRRGRADDVARDLEQRWRQIENASTGETLRPLRAVRALAIAQASGARDAGLAEGVLAPLRPVEPGELAPLRARWPEMAAFLAANGL